MKMVKSLVLGSAAAFVAMSAAQAADLPVKAKAVEYVKVCSLYGAGFWYIPGTDTCIKLGGYVQVSMGVNTNSVFTGNTGGAGGAQNAYTNAFTWRSRTGLEIDTRTATEYGVVRTFSSQVFTWTGGTYAGTGTGASVYEPIGPLGLATTTGLANGGVGPGTAAANVNALFAAPQNASQGGVALGTIGVYYAFIQFAGFTIGKAASQFSAPWNNYPGNIYDGLVGGGGAVTGVNQFTYTAQFGNGVSASISAQDPTTYYQAGVQNIAAGGAFGTSNYAGTTIPDIVGQVRVDQAWGLFQLSAAAHNNSAAYYGGAAVAAFGTPGATEINGRPSDRWGYAVQGALSIKNLPTGPGDTINVQGVFTNGATRYNIQDLAGAAGANTIYGGSHPAGTYQGIGFGIAPDSVFTTGLGHSLVSTWGARGGFTHNWDAYWNTSIYGAYASIRYGNQGRILVCGVNGLAGGSFRATGNALGGAVTFCNPDYNIAQAGIITRWTPVRNLTFSGEAVFTHLDQKMVGTVVAPSAALGKPALVYQLRDQATVQVLLRAQRNF